MEDRTEDDAQDLLLRPLTEDSRRHSAASVSVLWTRSMASRLISKALELAVQNINELRQLVVQWEAEEQAYLEADAMEGASSVTVDVDQRFENYLQRFFARQRQFTPGVSDLAYGIDARPGPSGQQQENVLLTAEIVQDIYRKIKSTWQYNVSPIEMQGLEVDSRVSEPDLSFPAAVTGISCRHVSNEYVEEERWKDVLYADSRPYMPIPPSYVSTRDLTLPAEGQVESFAAMEEDLIFLELLRKEQIAEAVRCSPSEDQRETDAPYVFERDLAYRDSGLEPSRVASSLPSCGLFQPAGLPEMTFDLVEEDFVPPSTSTIGPLAPLHKPLYRAAHDETVMKSNDPGLRFLSPEDRFSLPLFAASERRDLMAESEGRGLSMDISSCVAYMDVIPENVFEEFAEDDPATDMYKARPFLVLLETKEGDDGVDSTNSSLTSKDAMDLALSSSDSSQPAEQNEAPDAVLEDDLVLPFDFPPELLGQGAYFRPLQVSPVLERNVQESNVNSSNQGFSCLSFGVGSSMSSAGSTEGNSFTGGPEDSGSHREVPLLIPNTEETQIVSYVFMKEDHVSTMYATEPSPVPLETKELVGSTSSRPISRDSIGLSLSSSGTTRSAAPPQNDFAVMEDDIGPLLGLPEEPLVQEGPVTPLQFKGVDEIESLEKFRVGELVPDMYTTGLSQVLIKKGHVSEVLSSTSCVLVSEDTILTTRASEIMETYRVRDVFSQVDESAFADDFQILSLGRPVRADVPKYEAYGDSTPATLRGFSFLSSGGSSQQAERRKVATPLMEENLASSFSSSQDPFKPDDDFRLRQAPLVAEKNVNVTETNTSSVLVKGRTPEESVPNLEVPRPMIAKNVRPENVWGFLPKETAAYVDTPLSSLVPLEAEEVLCPDSSHSVSTATIDVAPFLSDNSSSLPAKQLDETLAVTKPEMTVKPQCSGTELDSPVNVASANVASEEISLPVGRQEGNDVAPSLYRRGGSFESKEKLDGASDGKEKNLGSNSSSVQIPLKRDMLSVLGTVIQVMESIFTASGAVEQLRSRLGQ